MVAIGGACGSDGGENGTVSVVASVYPVAEAAKQVGGEHVRVTNLTPAGVEPHDIELSTDDVDRIEDADVVLYVGGGLQPGVEAAARQRATDARVDVAAGLLRKGADPHFWLDPDLMAKAVSRVRNALRRADPQHAQDYAANADQYISKLRLLSAEFSTGLTNCQRDDIVTAHAAFDYLAERYGLTQHAITGVSPESEPDPQRLVELAELIEREGVAVVFYEELVPRDFADTLAEEADVATAVLNPLEGLTQKQAAAGEDYVSVMRKNLVTLITALDCDPAV